MRAACPFVFLALLFVDLPASARPTGEPTERYGIGCDLKGYPQDTPRAALASVLRAIDAKRFDYLLAQLSDPVWVDDRVTRIYGGRFAEQLEDTRSRLGLVEVKLLRRFLSEGKWSEEKDHASARLDGVEDRAVFFVKKGERWYLENQSKPGP